MRSAEDAEKLMKRYCRAARHGVGTSQEMDSSVLDDALAAYDKSTEKPAATQPNVWRITMKSTVMKLAALAAAAAITVAALLWTNLYWHPGQQEDYEIANSYEEPQLKPTVQKQAFEEKDVEVMLAAGDVDGLVTMVSQADFKTQVRAANYLARTDCVEALEVLEKLNAGHAGDDPPNPFAVALEKIKERVRPAVDETRIPSVARQSHSLVRDPAVSATEVLLEDPREEPTQGLGETPHVASPEADSGPILSEGVCGHAYYFDGVDDYIVSETAGPLGNSPRTVCAWVATLSTSSQVILSYGGASGTGGSSFRLGLSCGDCQGVTADISYGAVTYRADVADGEWHHYAIAVPDIEEVNLAEVIVYQDGLVLSDTRPCAAYNLKQILNTEGDIPVNIGRFAAERAYYLKGVIDEVAIFERALSDHEIQQIYRNLGGLNGREPGLVGYWNFDNDDGEVAKDSSPYGNHGVLAHESGHGRQEPVENTVAIPSDGETLPELTEGASGYGYYFDGVGDYIESQTAGPFGSSPRTICAWAATSFTTGQYILSYGRASGPGGSSLRLGLSAWGECQGVTVDVSSGAVTYPVDVADGNWHHYAVVVPDIEEVNLAKVLVYKDGTLLSDIEPHEPYNLDRVLNTEADGGINIGRFAGEPTYYFNGVIDEVAIFDRVLSNDEIRTIYQNLGRLRGYEAGLVGYWNFDNDEGDIVKDRSRYGNHGRLGGL